MSRSAAPTAKSTSLIQGGQHGEPEVASETFLPLTTTPPSSQPAETGFSHHDSGDSVVVTKTDYFDDKEDSRRLREPAARTRTYFPETMLWRPEVITDEQGRAELTVPLADSITTWRLSGMGVAKGGQLGDGGFVHPRVPAVLRGRGRPALPDAGRRNLPADGDVQLHAGRPDHFAQGARFRRPDRRRRNRTEGDAGGGRGAACSRAGQGGRDRHGDAGDRRLRQRRGRRHPQAYSHRPAGAAAIAHGQRGTLRRGRTNGRSDHPRRRRARQRGRATEGLPQHIQRAARRPRTPYCGCPADASSRPPAARIPT